MHECDFSKTIFVIAIIKQIARSKTFSTVTYTVYPFNFHISNSVSIKTYTYDNDNYYAIVTIKNAHKCKSLLIIIKDAFPIRFATHSQL